METNKMKVLRNDDAIKFIETAISENCKNVVAQTNFAKLFIDTDYKNFEPGINLIIEPWDITGPKNSCFDISGIKNDVDYYICICNPSSDLRLHLLCIEAIYKSMFKVLFGVDLDSKIIDALLIMHSYEKDGRTLTSSMLSEDFLNNNLGRFVRKNDMVQWLVKDHFETKIKLGKEVLMKSEKLFSEEAKKGNCINIPDTKYNNILYGIILYISKIHNISITSKDINLIFG